jgi:PTS system mannose-specific IIA component
VVEVIVISENRTAVEMLKTVHKVLGARAVRNIHPLVIKSNYSPRKVSVLIEARVRAARRRIDGVLLLTEVFGSTQSNLCLSLLETGNIRLISGYNLPMLIKAATLNQSATLKKLVPELKSVGRKYIRDFNCKK